MTIRSLEDLGYTVNPAAADEWRKTRLGGEAA